MLASGTHFKQNNISMSLYSTRGERQKEVIAYCNEPHRQHNWSIKGFNEIIVSGKSLLCTLCSLKWALTCHCFRKPFLMRIDCVTKNLLQP